MSAPDCEAHDTCPVSGLCRHQEQCVSQKVGEDFAEMEPTSAETGRQVSISLGRWTLYLTLTERV